MRPLVRSVIGTFVFTLFLGSVANAAGELPPVQQQLDQFNADPKTFMNELPAKVSVGEPKLPGFDRQAVEDKEFVTEKDVLRRAHFGLIDDGRAAYEANDRPENLVDSLKYRTLESIENAGLRRAELDESPWSDDYWALYSGVLAKRYGDPNFPGDKDWKINSDYILNSLGDIVNSGNSSSIERLSPAEKYDLLVGDPNQTMTKKMLAEGESYYRSYGKVEPWMGICHGWAVAAYMLPRPKNAITVTAADGKTKIRFLPSDIKALSSLLWANTDNATRFIGGRCNVKNPKQDANGRVTEAQDCFDNNPGSWHLAVVNQIGVSKRSFVLDATYDYEVWNQPVYSYSYTYFNPQTTRAVSNLEDATVRIDEFTNDKFASYRSRNASKVVGIAMDITYVVETQPSLRRTDSSQYDALTTARYMYDLEIDRYGRVIGGEWYNNTHPDFLWTAPEGTRAQSVADEYLNRTGSRSSWDGRTTIPRDWQQVAPRASRYGQPVARIVEVLATLSNAGIN